MLSLTESAVAAVQLQPVLTGLSSPLYLTHARDGSNGLFILEQGGRILVLQPGAAAPTVFVDITAKVLSGVSRAFSALPSIRNTPRTGDSSCATLASRTAPS